MLSFSVGEAAQHLFVVWRCQWRAGLQALALGSSIRVLAALRRHHRSPTSANKPAGQDPKTRLGARNGVSTALFAREGQSFLDNLIAGLGQSRAS
jgi:hypothetical protein